MVPGSLLRTVAVLVERRGVPPLLRSGDTLYHRRVRKLIKIALIALGIRWFLRWRKRRQAEAELDAGPPPPPPADPADQLRQKLAESRAEATTDEPEEPSGASVADRRAEVHEQGRAALDEMKPSDEA